MAPTYSRWQKVTSVCCQGKVYCTYWFTIGLLYLLVSGVFLQITKKGAVNPKLLPPLMRLWDNPWNYSLPVVCAFILKTMERGTEIRRNFKQYSEFSPKGKYCLNKCYALVEKA